MGQIVCFMQTARVCMSKKAQKNDTSLWAFPFVQYALNALTWKNKATSRLVCNWIILWGLH